MTATLTPADITQDALVIRYSPPLKRMSDDEFFDFCMANKDLRIELTSEGDLIIMPPTGMKTGNRNFTLTTQFGMWAIKDGTGVGSDSSTLFSLPNGAKRSPDLAWVRKERWEALSKEQQEKFAPLCPDFVVELRSPTDNLRRLQKKMEEYVASGAKLGWLIDPSRRKVYIYRPQASVEILNDPQTVSGEPLLAGFTLDIQRLWE